ncbi:CCA tRNA nucleotidyltransferase [Paenibacillus filicis]|uniref:CCA tRNA nucleotidyltransferase n=1 Tax=Paenibacillus gyeongsangnamensis TaxID=3388067 RepID=A0ABT4Q7X8_9BACL|nr:CCA tRNA nucleotidyltransferase [Paenibacillus filicis]MCZ8512975.1 CCA tRNA nucleotidyltransferase [Paenibacillus filicis]
MSEPLEQQALQIVRELNMHGYAAYLVGGCVRDKQLGRPVKDYDIATSAKPEDVQKLFPRTIPTGLQHGTITVLRNRVPYEVTTFRREGNYEAFRRPSEVEYIDNLQEDLERRDFTMNSMALDAEGKLVDPFGGMNDVRDGLLRCVGDPRERFQEDALRMLRCIRFAAEYGLRIEQGTWTALLEKLPLLRHIAMERVRAELERMMNGSDPQQALRLLAASKALRYVKQELRLADLDGAEADPGWAELPEAEWRWAYWFMKLGADRLETENDLRQLTFSKQQTEAIGSILGAYHAVEAGNGDLPAEAKRIWVLAALQFGIPAMSALASLYALQRDDRAQQRWADCGPAWLEGLPVSQLSDLAITGKDLIETLRRKPGPWMGKLLQRLLEQAALGELPNERSPLLAAAEAEYERMQEMDTQ